MEIWFYGDTSDCDTSYVYLEYVYDGVRATSRTWICPDDAPGSWEECIALCQYLMAKEKYQLTEAIFDAEGAIKKCQDKLNLLENK